MKGYNEYMAKNKIQMKTYEMDKHCSLLLTRIVEDLNIDIDYTKDRTCVFASKCDDSDEYDSRIILLGYTKPMSDDSEGNEYTVLIRLSDQGHNSILDTYMDEESMNTVHDVCVDVIMTKHKENTLKFTYENLNEINRKVLLDINSTRVVDSVEFLNKDSLVTKKSSRRYNYC